jgi:hypothetical protein
MLVLLQLTTAAVTPLKLTVLVPCAAPKLLPWTTTLLPLTPQAGDNPLTTGTGVNPIPLLATPFTVTTTGPAVAPLGTWLLMLLSVHPVVTAAWPLNVTVPPAVPNPLPVTVTGLPATPDAGVTPVITAPMVKLTRLLVFPPTVTFTGPLLAVFGITATMAVLLQLTGFTPLPARTIPFSVAVLNPAAPKPVPCRVSVAPTGPTLDPTPFTSSPVIFGTTVNRTPLLATPFTLTTTLPLVAPAGAVTPMLPLLQLVTPAATPLNPTVLVPALVLALLPKLAPLMVTAVPVVPAVTDSPLMLGACPSPTCATTIIITAAITTPLTLPISSLHSIPFISVISASLSAK